MWRGRESTLALTNVRGGWLADSTAQRGHTLIAGGGLVGRNRGLRLRTRAFCEIRYCIVRHVGFLIGQVRPAGDAEAIPGTVEQVIEMLRRPLPEDPALAGILDRLEQVSFDGRLATRPTS